MAEAKRFAMVCAANMNRSMEAHKVALNAGLDVKSYGAGNRVKLPGASRDNPNVFEFGSVTYKDIYDKLMAEDEKLYTRNGLKDMLERNMTIKQRDELQEVITFLKSNDYNIYLNYGNFRD